MGHFILILISGGPEETNTQLRSEKYENKDEAVGAEVCFPCRGNRRYKGLEAKEMEYLEN